MNIYILSCFQVVQWITKLYFTVEHKCNNHYYNKNIEIFFFSPFINKFSIRCSTKYCHRSVFRDIQNKFKLTRRETNYKTN